MTKTQITQVVKSLIAEDKLEEALQTLSDYVRGIDSDLENDLLMQTSAYNRNEKEKMRIPRENYNMARANLSYNISQILKKLPEQGNDVIIETPDTDDAVSLAPSKVANSVQKILFFAATPEDQVILNLGKELRKIKTQLSASKYRDKFDLENEMAVRISDITKAMLAEEPQIVHFSGHGSGEQGLVVENDTGEMDFLPTENVDELFELFKDTVNCVVLNACFSKPQAEVISKHGIYVVGMNDEMADTEAIKFSVGFYQSLGEGKGYEFAFKMARVQINKPKYKNIPELWYNGEKIQPKT